MPSSRFRASIRPLGLLLAACATGACSSSSFAVAEPRGGDDTGGEPLADGGGDSGARSDTSPSADASAKDSSGTDLGLGGADVGDEAIVADALPPLDGGPLPTIALDHPGDTACYAPPGDTVAVHVTVTGWTLADLGTCAGKPRCGPVYVTVDGTNCNLTTQPYNTIIGASGSSDLVLTACSKGGRTGLKTVRAELRNDDGSAFAPTVEASRDTDFTGSCP